MFVRQVLNELLGTKDINTILKKYRRQINDAVSIYLSPSYNISLKDNQDIDNIKCILEISNIMYNNTDSDLLLLNDGVYDLLLELYKTVDKNYQVGAQPIKFAPTNISEPKELKKVARVLDKEKVKDFLYIDTMLNSPRPNNKLMKVCKRVGQAVSKRVVNIKHNYPNLVGTLDKCKFVMTYQAEEKGVANDSNVKIFERDFIGKQVMSGIIPNIHTILYGEMSFKYDGVSIEADVTNMVVGARTRGDANQDIAADLTPIFYGYEFPKAPKEFWNKEPFGMKFEAIITEQNLIRFNKLTGNNYKNGRTAIIGLLGRSDAYKYRELITLVPLETSLDIDRETEVTLINNYYTRDVYFIRIPISGDVTSLLFQVKKFTEEAEYMRCFIPFMYDGVVFRYVDKDMINKLGRTNAVNKYAMAIKFTPLKAMTIFRYYKYTVGQYGVITPMIYYDPVEFYGAIHDHSTASSFERFKSLAVRDGTVLGVEYVNDVMPYVTVPDIEINRNNTNPLIPFIDKCPSCGTKLEMAKSGRNLYCPNIACPQRNIKRIVNMLDKLNMKDFAEARIESIKAQSLSELFTLEYKDVAFLGDTIAKKLLSRIRDLKTLPINDYDIIGSLGFELLGRRKWKVILNNYSLHEIMSMTNAQIYHSLTNIKGVGSSACKTIIDQMEFFRDDLNIIANMSNVIVTKGTSKQRKIRFTGFRDADIVKVLRDKGYDVDDNAGVTKDTDILLIPEEGHTSTKTAKAVKYNQAGSNIQIIPVADFMDNVDKYL